MPTIIWMGTEFSLYTIQQASRRSWRIGQDKDVRVYYFVYTETMQEKALSLIAAKLGAAARINGDTIPDEGLSEFDEYAGTDLVSTLTHLLQDELNREEAMKQVNEAYELAQKGNCHAYAHTPFSFAGCRDAGEIKKRYRELANQYHPDKANTSEDDAQTVETLADLFKQANVAFHEGEERMGDFTGDVLPGEVTYGEVDDDVDAVIRKLLLGEEAARQAPDAVQPAPPTETQHNGAYAEPEEAMINLAGVGLVPLSEKHNYRLDFTTLAYVHKDETQAALTGTTVPLTNDATVICSIPGQAEVVEQPDDDGILRVDRETCWQMRTKLLKSKKTVDTIFTIEGMNLVVIERDWDAYGAGTTTAPYIAYQIDFAGDYIHLAANPPSDEEKKTYGKHHGRKVKYKGYSYFLFGPPVRILPPDVEIKKRETQPAQPKPVQEVVRPPKPERLAFGVHDLFGNVRVNGLDSVMAEQMSLLG